MNWIPNQVGDDLQKPMANDFGQEQEQLRGYVSLVAKGESPTHPDIGGDDEYIFSPKPIGSMGKAHISLFRPQKASSHYQEMKAAVIQDQQLVPMSGIEAYNKGFYKLSVTINNDDARLRRNTAFADITFDGVDLLARAIFENDNDNTEEINRNQLGKDVSIEGTVWYEDKWDDLTGNSQTHDDLFVPYDPNQTDALKDLFFKFSVVQQRPLEVTNL